MQDSDVVSIVNMQDHTVLEADGSKDVRMGPYHDANQQWRFIPDASGSTTGWLENVASGKVLDANKDDASKDGCRVQQWRKHEKPAPWQKWTIISGNGDYNLIVNGAPGAKVLDANKGDTKNNGCKVQLWTQHVDQKPEPTWQRWKMAKVGETEALDGGRFWLENESSGKVLDVDQAGIDNNGAKVQLWEKHDDLKQQWRLEAVTGASNTYWLVNRETQCVLDADKGDASKDGCKVQQSAKKDSDNANQHWSLEDVGNGRYLLRSAASDAASDKVLDADGSKVQLWTHHSGSNQQWELLLIVPGVA